MSAVDFIVNGVGYGNSAAKFWRDFFDDARSRHENLLAAEMSAPAAGPLRPSMLFPHLELQEDLLRLEGQDAGRLLRETVAELELFGPPAPVEVRLFCEEGLLSTCALPAERVDAEIFQYLAAWILAWARTPAPLWNAPLVEGRLVAASDPRTGWTCDIAFSLRHEELHEGLLRRTLRLSPLPAATAS